MVSGFGVPVSFAFFPMLLLFCALTAVLYRWQLPARHPLAVGILLLLGYLTVLFLRQNTFLSGAGQMANCVVDTLNAVYSGQLAPVSSAHGTDNTECFLLLAFFPFILALGWALLKSGQMTGINLLVFPLLAGICICGGATDAVSLLFVLLGMMAAVGYSGHLRQNRMWGGSNADLRRKNYRRFQQMQKQTAVLLAAMTIVLSVPGFLLVSPLLRLSLKPAEGYAKSLQSTALNRVLKFLPEISAGRLELNLETVGGGVQDGALEGREGYLLEGVEDLRLTLNRKPEETLFLKGFVGTAYEDGAWKESYANIFDGAAINWNTEDSPRIYIQNLPFLRTAFALNQQEIETVSPAQLSVTRLNANDSYTYVPYGAYLNSYYEISGGDGAVVGQTEQEDSFLFFTREDMETVLKEWNALEDTASVLDRVEESYRAFTTVSGLNAEKTEALAEKIQTVKKDNRWDAENNIDDISSWIRKYLAEGYSYLLTAETPEGEDALECFLYHSKTGNSVHYASAAVMLYRLFGVPARYVVGYEIPAALFSPQTGGRYTATVQSDNAQAWAEIYVPGIGWMPKDMTPGVIGTLEEVGTGGERIESVVAPEESGDSQETAPQEESPPPTVSPENSKGKRRLARFTLRDILSCIARTAVIIVPLIGIVLLLRWLCRSLGMPFIGCAGREGRTLNVFRAFCRRMKKLGLPEETDSQSEEFLLFCENQIHRRAPQLVSQIRPAVNAVYQAAYGCGSYEEAQIYVLRKLLLASLKPIK